MIVRGTENKGKCDGPNKRVRSSHFRSVWIPKDKDHGCQYAPCMETKQEK